MKLLTSAIFLACVVLSIEAKYEGYVFVHFVKKPGGGDIEDIFIAASEGNNALNWTTVNNGEPILKSDFGTRGLRDPFIIRAETGDKFYLVATDLLFSDIADWPNATRFGSRYIEIWESTDLVNWSKQRHTLVSSPEVGCSWAPEAHYDKESGKYLVFWASTLYSAEDVERTGPIYHRLLASKTEDFVNFDEPQVWQDSKNARIDTTVFEEDGVFFRFTVGPIDGCHDIFQERSTNLYAPAEEWEVQMSCLRKKVQAEYIEGPTIIRTNPGDVNGDKYILFVDENGRRGYVPLETADIKNPDWKVASNCKFPYKLPVTAEELERVRSAKKH